MEEYRSLQKAHNSKVSRKSQATGRAPKESLDGVQKEILHTGGRFSVVGKLWVSKGTLDLPFPENFNPSSPLHYKSPDAQACGNIVEIYLDLKLHLQSILTDAGQRAMFKECVSFDLFSVYAHNWLSCIVHETAQSRTIKLGENGTQPCSQVIGPRCLSFQHRSWPHKYTKAVRTPQVSKPAWSTISCLSTSHLSRLGYQKLTSISMQGVRKGPVFFLSVVCTTKSITASSSGLYCLGLCRWTVRLEGHAWQKECSGVWKRPLQAWLLWWQHL